MTSTIPVRLRAFANGLPTLSDERTLLYEAADHIETLERPVADDGRVPDRETAWLIERNVSPPQYVTEGHDFTSDAWRARRFKTEREADNERLRLCDWMRDQSKAVEHMFINKADAAFDRAIASRRVGGTL